MKYNDLPELTDNKKLNKYDFANLFNVVELGEKSYFNISKTISFANNDTILPSYYTTYKIKATDSWTGISFQFYNTIKLWWLICKFNNINNPFEELIERNGNKNSNASSCESGFRFINE
jgi:nucleoid-associated protein YgaU